MIKIASFKDIKLPVLGGVHVQAGQAHSNDVRKLFK